MNELKGQPFYEKLTEKFAEKVEDMITKKNNLFSFRLLEWFSWGFALFFMFINYDVFNQSTDIVNIIYILVISGGFVILTSILTEVPKKKFNSSKQKVQEELLFDICTCKTRCTCKAEFREYMKKINIDLFE